MRVNVCVLVVVSALALPVWAQERPSENAEAPPLHLADAIAFAREHHPSLKAAAARVTAARQGSGDGAEPDAADVRRDDLAMAGHVVQSRRRQHVHVHARAAAAGQGQARPPRRGRAARTADRMAADAAVQNPHRRPASSKRMRRSGPPNVKSPRPARRSRCANEPVRATEAAYGLGRGTQATVVRASLAETELSERLVMLQADADMRRVDLNAAMGRDPSHADWRARRHGAERPSCRHCRCCSIAPAIRIQSCSRHARESRKPTRAPACAQNRGKARLGRAGRLHADARPGRRVDRPRGRHLALGALGEEARLRVHGRGRRARAGCPLRP